MENRKAPVAVQINLFPSDDGVIVVPFSHYDMESKTHTEIGRFVIPWHEWQHIADRMAQLEQGKIEFDSGISPI